MCDMIWGTDVPHDDVAFMSHVISSGNVSFVSHVMRWGILYKISRALKPHASSITP